MDGVAPAHPDVVRGMIAGEWLRVESVNPVLGTVTLRSHQMEAAHRLDVLLERSRGALLADDVGLGKTYVALAVARSYRHPLVVAPASLREMWLVAAGRAAVVIRFISVEALSRNSPLQCDADLLIVDEAHHFRNPATARYASLTRLVARTPILLLTATPLHNRDADITVLLSLFLGSAARTLSSPEIATYVVRRNQAEVAGDFPLVRAPVRIAVSDAGHVLRLLLALPPPTPARDGRVAAAIITHTLVRLWASSDAALREGIRRRLAKTIAIRNALETGHYPTRRELAAWTYRDSAVQLGFAQILAPERERGCTALLGAATAHERALTGLLESLPRDSSSDAERVQRMRALRGRHAGERIVAFSQFAETAAMYFRWLRRDGCVAMLTSHGARIASGAIKRQEALERFAPIAANAARPRPAEDISLLVATDLLSEGVNLQDASVVVHLDLPWTAATLEQRVGRVARLGSRKASVFVYALDPPASSKQLLRAEAIIRRKAGLADASIGASRIPPLFASSLAVPRSNVEDAEAIRLALSEWISRAAADVRSPPVCAGVTAELDGVLALVVVRGKPVLIAGSGAGMSDDFRCVRAMVAMANGAPACVPPMRIHAAVHRIRQWTDGRLASDDAGAPGPGRTVLARRLAARLARDLSSCPQHERASYSARIAAVRHRIQSPFTLGVEREIEDLLRSAEASDFLSGLERIIGPEHLDPRGTDFAIRAVLILQRT